MAKGRAAECVDHHSGPQSAYPCPCCGHAVHAPTLDMIMELCSIGTIEARILKAVWGGRGHTVPMQRIFDVLYGDCQDGGPPEKTMYKQFKFGLFRLRQKLQGTPVWVENVGHYAGYRLVVGQKARVVSAANVNISSPGKIRKMKG